LSMSERNNKFLKSKTARMLKQTQSLFIQTPERSTKNGKSSIPIKLERLKQRE
jgi:hypothetical protein